jgi:hypothetical protein
MLVNFYRKSLAEEGGGHFSPLAAYDPPSDQVLIMDVARYKVRVCVEDGSAWTTMTSSGKGMKKKKEMR